MAQFENTLIDLILRMGRTMMKRTEFFEGTLTDTGTTTTFDDSSRGEADDYFNQSSPPSYFYVYYTTDNAAPIGEERKITDWVNTTTIGTVVALSVATGAGDKYVILNEYRWTQLKEAINMAIDRAKSKAAHLDKLDESVELAASVYDYPIPAGFTHIYRVTMIDGNGQFHDPIPPEQWGIVRGTTPPRLHLYTMPVSGQHQDHPYGDLWAENSLTAGRVLRIEGLQQQARLENDTDICYLDPEFVCYQAMAYLHATRVKRRENDPDEQATQQATCQALADRALNSMRKQMPTNMKRVNL